MNTPKVASNKKGTTNKAGLLTTLVAASALQACVSSQYPLQPIDLNGNPIPQQQVDQNGNLIPLQSETDTEYLERQNNNEVIPNNNATPMFELKSSAHNLAQIEGESCKVSAKQENFEKAQKSYENCRNNIASIPSITTEAQANVRHQVCVITANKWLEESNLQSEKSCDIQSCEIEATMLGQKTGGGLFTKGLCSDGVL